MTIPSKICLGRGGGYTKKSIKRGLVSLFTGGLLIAQPTLEHPVWTENHHDYVPAQDLKVGDTFLDGKGAPIRLDSLAIKPDTTLTVYNFEVNDLHNYYVGRQEVLVHNTCVALRALFGSEADYKKLIEHLNLKNNNDVLSKFLDGTFDVNKLWKVIYDSRLVNGKTLFKPPYGTNLSVFTDIQKVITNIGDTPAKLAKLKDALYNVNGGGVIQIAYYRAAKVMSDFSDRTSFESVINAIASPAWKNQQGADWVLRYLEKRTKLSQGNLIESFEALVKEGEGLFRADIKLTNGILVELKSWGGNYILGIKNRALTAQLANYFKQQAKFTQVFDFDRIRSDATGFATIAEAKATIKAEYVTLFKKDLNATYTAMGGFETNGSAYLKQQTINSFQDFTDAVNNPNSPLHSKLFSFIDIQ
jgi:Pretoxin HINT domain